ARKARTNVSCDRSSASVAFAVMRKRYRRISAWCAATMGSKASSAITLPMKPPHPRECEIAGSPSLGAFESRTGEPARQLADQHGVHQDGPQRDRHFTLSRSASENSMPTENMSNTTPISANNSNTWTSDTDGPGVNGP